MKRNSQFILSDVADTHILVPIGKAMVNFNGIVTLNDMGAAIWNMLENDITREKLLSTILDEYDVSAETAAADIDSFLNTLRSSGCLEE